MCVTCSAEQSLPGFDERQDVGIGLLVSGQRGGGGAGGQGSETRQISQDDTVQTRYTSTVPLNNVSTGCGGHPLIPA